MTPDTALSEASVAVVNEAGRGFPPPEPRAEALRLELADGLDLRGPDADALAALIAQRPHCGVFMSRAWLSGFFKDPPAGCRAHLAIFREGEALRGLAPLGLRAGGGQNCVTLLGGGAGSDRTDLLASRGFEPRCADLLLAWLRDRFGASGFVLRLRDVPQDSALWAAMHRLARDNQVALAPREVHAGPFLNVRESRALASTGLAAAMVLQESLRRHRRWLDRRGHVRIEILRDPGEALDAFDTLRGFLHERWRSAGGESAADDVYRQRFNRHAIPLLLADDYLRMVRISVDLRTVAVVYGLAAGSWWGAYLVGYDRPWAGRIHLGRLALGCAIELSAQEGAVEFDFLKGAEPVKYLWPVRERTTLDADVYSSRTRPQLTRAVHASREMAAALGNAARHLVSRHVSRGSRRR
ncbi:MAG: GNAT family N-acetyltransferase [Acidobacteria bacterium]|nr:GNAT family N-acetyltransferase [Acidobacteriota bacterium]